MGHTYEVSKKVALKTIIILAVVTVVEVLIALTGKGYIIEGLHFPWYIMNFVMICMSLYKAYLIVGEFMHMRHEVKALGMTVVLPTLLLVWAIIAFMY
jgi:cytochrome c oxidase subunit IV